MNEGAAPRIPLLDPGDARAAAAAAGVVEIAADLSVFRVWLHHPRLARWLSDLLMGLLWEGRLDPRLRELVIMRLGWATNSDYEWTQHWRIAGGLGVPEADLLGVRDWRSHDGFGPAERAVLAATDETLADGAISAATWQACRRHVSDDAQVLLELVGAIGVWRMVAGILRSLEVPLEDGVGSWPPDGEGPR
ncbi:MAG: carboxymuconolactone decarboxylase family protein [Acidimicrobiales bacterium]